MTRNPQRLTVAVVAACPVPYGRGTPVRIVRLAENVAARGHDVHLVTFHLGSGGIDASVRVHRTPSVKTYRKLSPGPSYQKLLVMDPLLMFKLRRVLKQQPFDVIHAHHFEGLIVARAALRGRQIPLIWDAHTLLASELPSYGLGLPTALKKRLGQGLDRRLPALADHVISVTQRIRDQLVQSATVPADRITVISNGVECDLFDTVEDRRQSLEGPKQIVFAGNLAAYQGFSLLLDAFSRIKARRKEVRLIVATESSFEPYEKLARELGVRESIELVSGAFEGLPAILANADLAVSPRVDCDGIPLKILNYMAARRPVLAFKGSAPGLIHGQTAWLVENANVSALAEGAIALMDDTGLSRSIGERGRAYIEERHSWERVAGETERIYQRLSGLATPNQSLYSPE